jgi:hypothetical protein
MLHRGTLVTGAVIVALSSIGASALVSLPAGASTQSVTASPAKGLLTAAEAKHLGFTKTADKPVTSSNTRVTGCGKGAQVAFEDASGSTGLISQVLVCKTPKVAAGLLKKEKSVGTAAALKPPKQLGSAAIEREASASTYAIYWQRGKLLELVALDTNVKAASSSTTTSVPAVPLTAPQQQTLVKSALKQDGATK